MSERASLDEDDPASSKRSELVTTTCVVYRREYEPLLTHLRTFFARRSLEDFMVAVEGQQTKGGVCDNIGIGLIVGVVKGNGEAGEYELRR